MAEMVQPEMDTADPLDVQAVGDRVERLIDVAHMESYTVIALGAVQAVFLVTARPFSGKGNAFGCGTAKLSATGGSRALSPAAMFIIRAAIALYCILLQVEANFSVGIRINRFYTSWNWCILCLYFVVAARESWKLMRAKGGAAAESLVSRNGQLAVVLFHICTTMAMYIDTITWVALVPMLTTQNKDAEAAARFAGIFYSFRSYNQHGVNLLFMLLDYSLNRIPYFPHMLGYIQLLSCAFGVWANIFYLIFDVWLYPFLDTSKPWAWEAYTALFVSHWLFFLLFHVLMKVKQYLEKGALVKKAA